MRHFLHTSLLLAGLLGGSAGLPGWCQAPRAYFVSSACPGSANNPSVLRRLETTGAFTTVGTVTAGGTPLTLNGLGFNSADPNSVYGMTSTTTVGGLLVPPTLYRVALATGAATAVGPVALPPAPPSAGLDVGVGVVLNLLGDGGPNSHYYVGGTSFTYNLFTSAVSNVQFYVGDIDLAAPVYSGPVWRLADTSDPAAAAVIQNYAAAVSAAVRTGNTVPDGGIQDWAYDPLTDHLVSYLGVEQKFLTVSGLSTAPVAVVTTPAVPIPVSTNVGYMFRDNLNNLFGMTSADGIIYALNRVTGSYLGTSQDSGLGCTLGDATIGPPQVPLPVTLVTFEATAQPAGVLLRWTTATEVAFDRFEVQRQLDAEGAWEAVGTVPAAHPNGGGRYAFRDGAPQTGPRYYRLALVDRDGTRAYSPVRAVPGAAGRPAVAVFPNPARAQFTLALATPPPAGSRAELRDALGRVRWQAGLAQQQTSLDLTGLAPGVYVLRTDVGGAIATQRVVVE